MSDTPPRDIERLLQAAAEQRRRESGAPFELHPVTRRLLQDEVARTRRVAPDRAGLGGVWWQRFARHRFGLAMTASLLLLVGITRLVLWPPAPNATREENGVRDEFTALKEELAVKKKSLPPPPAPTVAPSTDKLAGRPTFAVALDAPNPGSTESAPAASSGVLAKDQSASPGAILQATLADTSQALMQEAPGLPAMTQNFRRADPAPATAKRAPVSAEPLANFQFVQNGSQLQVIDSDGSAYTGSIQVADAPAAVAMPSAGNAQLLSRAPVRTYGSRTAAAADSRTGSQAGGGGRQVAQSDVSSTQEEPATPAQAYSFRVTGANRTLNQTVLFTGQLHLPASAAANQAPAANSRSQQFQNAATNATQSAAQNTFTRSAGNQAATQNALPLGQSRISGEVRVGARPPVPLEAQPLGP